MDCTDFSDECPTSLEEREETVFSSRFQLIANGVLRGIVWIMGILAFVGNIVVMVVESKIFFKSRGKRLSTAMRTNHMLILNLALADFLMGVYLIMLGIAGVIFDGTFCSHELEWRSGATCQAMGALVVMSGEASVLTMVLLASVRVFAVMKPFSAASKPTRQTVLILIASTWIVSIFVALIPLSSTLQYIFATRAILPDNVFFQNVVVSLDSAKMWAEQLITYSPEFQSATRETVLQIRNAASWKGLHSAIENASLANILETENFIGYYSSNSVCIPRLFVTKSDNSWQFSIAVTIFNFIAFIFVAFAYFLLVLKTKQSSIKVTNSVAQHQKVDLKTTAIQRKIYRLLVTDFCCWIPISIMAFINFNGTQLPDVAYAVSAIVLLPINSALNPILYSDVFDRIFNNVQTRITSSPIWTSSARSIPETSIERLPPTSPIPTTKL